MVSRGLSPICTCRHPLGSQIISPVVRVEGWGVLCRNTFQTIKTNRMTTASQTLRTYIN